MSTPNQYIADRFPWLTRARALASAINSPERQPGFSKLRANAFSGADHSSASAASFRAVFQLRAVPRAPSLPLRKVPPQAVLVARRADIDNVRFATDAADSGRLAYNVNAKFRWSLRLEIRFGNPVEFAPALEALCL